MGLKIVLDIKGEDVELTMDEAESLYNDLRKIFGKVKQYEPLSNPIWKSSENIPLEENVISIINPKAGDKE